MKRTKQVKKVKRPHREGGDNDAAWLKADNTVHSLALPPNLSLHVLCLTLRPSRSTSRYTAEGLLHTCPHTHSHTNTQLATVSWAFFYAILSSSSPSSTLSSPLLPETFHFICLQHLFLRLFLLRTCFDVPALLLQLFL